MKFKFARTMTDQQRRFWKRVGEIVVSILTALIASLSTTSCLTHFNNF